ncbi:hypothetical protein HYFRA_00011878 [Hymenoscyphus fraxineus]|uniref:Uncharacterized protein n=1 Tax=Hymenoscyphus fraxineus TaxID=746836 RepID=A0A9N9KZ21_9HELO|nr:hypothetical protein HYFRA_00011878 [Hymenoscyphus fraxineus]
MGPSVAPKPPLTPLPPLTPYAEPKCPKKLTQARSCGRKQTPEHVHTPERYQVRQTKYKGDDATYMENHERYRSVEDAKRRSGTCERKMCIPTREGRVSWFCEGWGGDAYTGVPILVVHAWR